MPFDINDPETKAAVKTMIDEATAGLVAKRDELLKEVKELKKGKTVDPAEIEKLEAKIETLEGELATSQKAAKKATADLEAANKNLSDETGFTQNLLVDNGLTDELTKNGVTNPIHLKAAKALLRGGVQIHIDGDKRVAKVGDKALADHVKEWAGTNEGKHFVTASTNSGGGAGGGAGKVTGDISKMSPQQKMEAGRAAQQSK